MDTLIETAFDLVYKFKSLAGVTSNQSDPDT